MNDAAVRLCGFRALSVGRKVHEIVKEKGIDLKGLLICIRNVGV